MRKKLIALLAVMAMLVTSLCGCTSPFQKTDPIAGWSNTVMGASTLSANISVQTYVQEDVMGYSYLSSLTTDIQTEIDTKAGIAHVVQTTNRDVAGVSQLVDTTESYLTTTTDGDEVSYSYQKYMIEDKSVWGKFRSETSVDQYRESFDLIPSYSEGERQLVKKSEEEKGVYTFSWEVPGSVLAKYMGFSLMNTDIDNFISEMYFKASGVCHENNGTIVPHSMRFETSDEFVVDVNGSELPIQGMIIEIRFDEFNGEMNLEVPQEALSSATYKDVDEFFADNLPEWHYYSGDNATEELPDNVADAGPEDKVEPAPESDDASSSEGSDTNGAGDIDETVDEDSAVGGE